MIFLFLTASFMGSYAEEAFSVRLNEPFRIHADAPEPKTGGGDFYIVRISPADGMTAKESIPDSTVIFSTTGTYRITAAVMHMMKSSCGGMETEVFSEKVFSITVSE